MKVGTKVIIKSRNVAPEVNGTQGQVESIPSPELGTKGYYLVRLPSGFSVAFQAHELTAAS